LVAPSNTDSLVNTRNFHGVSRFEVGLKYLPQPDYLQFELPNTHHVLVTNEGSALTLNLIEALEAKGNKVVVLNLPHVPNPISKSAVSINSDTDQDIAKALTEVNNSFGKTGSFIYLHPHYEFTGGNFTQHFVAERSAVKSLFFLSKYLQKDLNELGQSDQSQKPQRANFLCVTRIDGKLGQGKRTNTSVIGGGISGLVKCLNLEWSSVFCRITDIQPELSLADITSHIIGELHDPNVTIIETGISDAGRKTTIATPADASENQKIKTTVNTDSVFLVSGGARGVTATCIIEMAKSFQCKFILLGRSDMEVEIPEFAKGELAEAELKRLIMTDLKAKGEKPSLPIVKKVYSGIIAKKEIEHTLSEIESHGAQVLYIKGDVTDSSSYKKELSAAMSQLGQVTGLIHGAGRLADKYIQDKTEADFHNVLSVKLDGLLSLLSAVQINELQHLILFSSVAGFYGNVGQTDYAIANEILSKTAHQFKTNHPHTHVSAINWGAWDSGMVSGELKAQFEAAGITLVNSDGGAAMLVNELNSDYANTPQVIIGGTLPAAVSYIGALQTHLIDRKLKLEDNPFLSHHVIQDNAVLPVVNAVGWMSQSCENIYPDFTVFKIEDTRLFKGIIFDGKEKENYTLELKEIAKDQHNIVFETTVLSKGAKLPTYHYKAKITLVNKKEVPQAPTFKHTVNADYIPVNGKSLYTDGSLFHSEYFQGIKEILDCTESQIVLSCIAPEVPWSAQGQFPIGSINTFFADIQYQGMLVWVQRFFGGSKSLPLQTDSALIYKPIPFGKELLVNVTITESTETKMVAECTVYDHQENVYIKTKGATVTISRQLAW
ncbi:MAG: NAD(P)-dependent dehydrogenase (short-subunit alcohol dehydrogenase family), partial [Limisphaerales bacterium]